jgi:hypothetical protein
LHDGIEGQLELGELLLVDEDLDLVLETAGDLDRLASSGKDSTSSFSRMSTPA